MEKVIRAVGVRIREVNGDRAYYNMHRDEIVLPERSQFKDAEGYYQTALHEVGHSTGHKSRMNRESLRQGTDAGFGSGGVRAGRTPGGNQRHDVVRSPGRGL